MVSIRERVFLVSGADFSQRKLAIGNIKKRILQNSSAQLNTLTLYSEEIEIKSLQENLFQSSFGEAKLIIFKDCFELGSSVREFLFNNLKKILTANYIIFETDKNLYYLEKNKKLLSDKFFGLLLKKAASFRVASSKKKLSLDDFMNSIRRNDLASSLYVLENLFATGAKEKVLGPQIIGILVRKFSYLKNPAEKDRYFEYLWEADRAIKEKGLSARLVIETLLVKLFGPQ